MTNYMNMVTMAISIFTMSVMSVDRYQAVVRPAQARYQRTVRRSLFILGFIWIFSTLVFIPVFTASRYQTLEHGSSLCFVKFNARSTSVAYTVVVFVAFYVLPLITIAIFYLLITASLHCRAPPGESKVSREARARKYKAAKIVFVVVVTFGTCWLPLHAVHLHDSFAGEDSSTSLAFYITKVIAYCLVYVNSMANPFIYSFMSKSFRESFSDVCCSCGCPLSHHGRTVCRNTPEGASGRGGVVVSNSDKSSGHGEPIRHNSTFTWSQQPATSTSSEKCEAVLDHGIYLGPVPQEPESELANQALGLDTKQTQT